MRASDIAITNSQPQHDNSPYEANKETAGKPKTLQVIRSTLKKNIVRKGLPLRWFGQLHPHV